MSNNNNDWDDEDDDDLDTEASTGDGSDLLKKLRKAKRADEKRIKELTEQLEGFSKVQRERTVKEILEQKGVNAKAARLVLKDLDEVTEESVINWLAENGDLFGMTPEVAESNQESDDNRATLRQQDTVTRQGITPDRASDLESRLDKAESAEDIIQLLYSQQ
tara:strand:+ start:32 stop:520 length:489 start_codon:yes stop_codon:yes gene_type:complete